MTATDLALLCMRLVAAFFIARHGIWKLGLAGGPGLDKTALFFDATGYRPGRRFAAAAAAAEIGAGLLLALGLFAPFAAAAAIAVLGSASLAVPRNDPRDPRIELAQALAIVPLGVALAGPGGYSLDHLIGLSIPLWGALVLVLAAIAAVFVGDRVVRARPAVRVS